MKEAKLDIISQKNQKCHEKKMWKKKKREKFEEEEPNR